MSSINGIFLWCLFSSIMASVIALIVVLAKMIFKNRISVRVYCLLWLFMLVRLIIPFAPESPISIFNLLVREGPKGAIYSNINIVSILSLIWLIGVAILVLVLICSKIIFIKRSSHFIQIDDSEALAILNDCKSKFGINIHILLYLAPCVKSPCIAGFIRPKIFIPENTYEFMNHQQIRYILMHELAHYKKGDILLNYVITAVNIIYWFNPVIWYAFIQMDRDREIECDTYVLEALEQDESIPYAMTLIGMTRFLLKTRRPVSPVSFYKTEKQIERRIDRIKLFRKGTYKISALALVCCVIVGAMTLTNATSFKERVFAQTGGNVEVSLTVTEKKGNLLNMAHEFSENLDNWLLNDVIPFYGSIYHYKNTGEKVEKYLEK